MASEVRSFQPCLLLMKDRRKFQNLPRAPQIDTRTQDEVRVSLFLVFSSHSNYVFGSSLPWTTTLPQPLQPPQLIITSRLERFFPLLHPTPSLKWTSNPTLHCPILARFLAFISLEIFLPTVTPYASKGKTSYYI